MSQARDGTGDRHHLGLNVNLIFDRVHDPMIHHRSWSTTLINKPRSSWVITRYTSGSCLVRTRFRFGVHICAFLCSRPVFRCAHLVVPVLVMVHNWSISILVTNPQLTPKWGSKMGSKSGQICHTNKQVFPSQKGPPEVLREHDSLNSESRLPPPDPENGPILDPFFGHFWRFWRFNRVFCT